MFFVFICSIYWNEISHKWFSHCSNLFVIISRMLLPWIHMNSNQFWLVKQMSNRIENTKTKMPIIFYVYKTMRLMCVHSTLFPIVMMLFIISVPASWPPLKKVFETTQCLCFSICDWPKKHSTFWCVVMACVYLYQ